MFDPSMFTGGLTAGIATPPATDFASMVPALTPQATQGPFAAGAPPQWSPPQGTILGMSPAQFSSLFGQMASAIGGGKTMGARLGQVAAQMGMAQLQAALAKNQQQAYSKSLSEILSALPERTRNGLGTLVGRMSDGGKSTPSILKDVPGAETIMNPQGG